MIKRKLLSVLVGQAFSTAVVSAFVLPAYAQEQPAQPAPVQEQAAAPAPAPAEATRPTSGVERVTITGSNIKRAEGEGALPVQVFSHEDIEKLGVTSVEQLLSAVSANTVVGANTVAQGVGASTYGESAASLRGLGQARTLVLVNGRRLANYATDGTAVDINSIPIASVERVEILTDGASAVYGSDAIGGVINFITRQNFSGFEVSAYTGFTKDGGGATNKAGFLAGWGDYQTDRYNLTLSMDWAQDDPIYGRQRSYARNSWLNDGTRDTSATPSGAVRTFDPNTNPAIHSLASQGSSLGNPLSPDNCAANGSAYDANYGTCRYNPSPMVPLVPKVTRDNIGGSFRFKVSEAAELFMEGFYSKQKTVTSEQPSPYSVSFLAPDVQFVTQNVYPAIILNPSNPAYQRNVTNASGQPVTVSYRAFDGGGRVHTDDADQAHFVLGLRGTVWDYDYDVAYNHNSNSVTETTQRGYQSQTALVKLLSGNDAFDPFTQYQTPALAAQIAATNYVGTMITSTLSNDSANAKISGDLFNLPAGTAHFALGASLTDEKLNLVPSAAYQSGDISGYGAQVLPLQVSRNSSSMLAEATIPVLKSLEGDVAVRSDRYPQTSSTNPKFSLRYQPSSRFLARASYGTGFREPSLPELYSPQASATTASFTDPVVGTLNQYNQTVGGNPNLKPEKSEQAAFGIVLEPVEGLSAAIDYWKISVSDLVTALSPQFIVDQAAAGNPTYTGLVTRDSLGNITNIVSTNINAGAVKTSGIDVDLRWLIAKTQDYGTFKARLAGTYLLKYDEKLPDGSVQPSIAKTVGPDGSPLNAVSAGGILFRWKHQLSLDWKYQQYDLTLTQNYQSGYSDAPRADCSVCDGSEAQHVNAFETWDIQGAYTGYKNLIVRLGIKNMFNKNPPQAITLGQYFQTGYDPTYYDPHGMFTYINATYRFF